MRTHYNNLKISEEATQREIKKAYKSLAQKWHPDRNLDKKEIAERNFKIISASFAVLSDPAKRRAYDDLLMSKRSRFTPAKEAYTPRRNHTTKASTDNTSSLLLSRENKKRYLSYSAASLLAFGASLLLASSFFTAGTLFGSGVSIVVSVMFIAAFLGNTLMVFAGSYNLEVSKHKILALALFPWIAVLTAPLYWVAMYMWATLVKKDASNLMIPAYPFDAVSWQTALILLIIVIAWTSFDNFSEKIRNKESDK